MADEVTAMERAQVAVPKLGAGLALTLSATVACEFFAPVKRPKADTGDRPKRGWTDEQREAAAERARQQMAARKAAKAAEA